MRLNLTFAIDGSIHGEGVDVARFVIGGRFDGVLSDDGLKRTSACTASSIQEFIGVMPQLLPKSRAEGVSLGEVNS
jgi:hypothetical protein